MARTGCRKRARNGRRSAPNGLGAALHYIGALQTNKVRDAVAIADAIHAIDRPKLAAALAREMERQGRRPDCFIQVNTGAEPQKAGIMRMASMHWSRGAGTI